MASTAKLAVCPTALVVLAGCVVIPGGSTTVSVAVELDGFESASVIVTVYSPASPSCTFAIVIVAVLDPDTVDDPEGPGPSLSTSVPCFH